MQTFTRSYTSARSDNTPLTEEQIRKYKGKRAMILLRVSTQHQEEMFGLEAQLNEVIKKLANPLGVEVTENIIIRDTYTGLDFINRDVLDQILKLAPTFDILFMDMLDRLGRKSIQREIYRAQLREKGVRILTTSAEDHADDDTLLGEIIRLLRGYKAEEEVADMVRRTRNGRMAKARGNPEKGIEPAVIGHGARRYGYVYVFNGKGKRSGYVINEEVIHTDPTGKKWTEGDVIVYIIDLLDEGVALRTVASILNDLGIPGPKMDRKGEELSKWCHTTVRRFARERAYVDGEMTYFTERITKVPGQRERVHEALPEEDWIRVPIPVLVKDRAKFERVQRRLDDNKQLAPRRNPNPQFTLMRGGFVRCGHCGARMRAKRVVKKVSGLYYDYYICNKSNVERGRRCSSGGTCSIIASKLDEAVWEHVQEFLQHPQKVAEKVETYRQDDPTAQRRKVVQGQLAEVQRRQARFRKKLTAMLEGQDEEETEVDDGTLTYLRKQLAELAKQETEYLKQLKHDTDTFTVWKTIQERVNELEALVVKAQQKDELTYQEKQDLVHFLGFYAIVWKPGQAEHRVEINMKPVDIMELIW